MFPGTNRNCLYCLGNGNRWLLLFLFFPEWSDWCFPVIAIVFVINNGNRISRLIYHGLILLEILCL